MEIMPEKKTFATLPHFLTFYTHLIFSDVNAYVNFLGQVVFVENRQIKINVLIFNKLLLIYIIFGGLIER